MSDALLLSAVDEMESGLIDADLGGGIFKKRIALPNRGKSASVRTLIATNKNNRWFFMLGFEKNQRDNIDNSELKTLKAIAVDLLKLTDTELNHFVTSDKLTEVCK